MLIVPYLLDIAESSVARDNLMSLAFGTLDTKKVAELWREGGVWQPQIVSVIDFRDDEVISAVLEETFARYQHVDEHSAKFNHRSMMAGDMCVVHCNGIIEHWLCAAMGWTHIVELDQVTDKEDPFDDLDNDLIYKDRD